MKTKKFIRPVQIIPFEKNIHKEPVVELWEKVFGYETDHNAPELVIEKKIQFENDLFFVAIEQGNIVGTVMSGYDGHRGWIYSLAVHPDYQHRGVGSSMLKFVEKRLSSLGCMKINLQIIQDNRTVKEFYKANGYLTEKRISMGKNLSKNIPGSSK